MGVYQGVSVEPIRGQSYEVKQNKGEKGRLSFERGLRCGYSSAGARCEGRAVSISHRIRRVMIVCLWGDVFGINFELAFVIVSGGRPQCAVALRRCNAARRVGFLGLGSRSRKWVEMRGRTNKGKQGGMIVVLGKRIVCCQLSARLSSPAAPHPPYLLRAQNTRASPVHFSPSPPSLTIPFPL